jgi:phosphomevalonate kinase
VKVVAPGKVLLFGAYSVLEGTEALVVAVDRYVVADTTRREPSPSREVRAALGDVAAPAVDVSGLYAAAQKLGLGSSAAVLVATLGARAAERGEDLASPAARRAIFAAAKQAHAVAQGGGSGVDIAASTYGGALFYAMDGFDAERGRTSLPGGLVLRVFWSGASARTSDLVARVKALGDRDRSAYRGAIEAVGAAVRAAKSACATNDFRALVAAGVANGTALADLGCAADAPVVPAAFADLGAAAADEEAAFYPSGAGGGDVGVWLGGALPSARFVARAASRGMSPLDLGVDHAGLRIRKD